jgi:HD-like signal output (HDOD) protein
VQQPFPEPPSWPAGDPVLPARVLKPANSAYYGLPGRVSSRDFAVTLLGRDTARAIAAAAAAGVVGDAVLPPGFWSYSGATAAAAALVAPKVGANRSEAFCLGLLHDLGAALLHQIDPARRTAIVDAASATGVHPVHAEVPAYGLGHAEAAQRVLTAWRFPVELADAVGGHHRHPRDAMTALERTLQAAKALVRDLPTVPRHEVPEDVEAALRASRVPPREEVSLRQQALEQAGQLAATLSDGGAG